MGERKTVIAGSSFHKGAGAIICRLRGGEGMELRRSEPGSVGYKHDVNAIEVRMFGTTLGYLPRGVAAEFAPKMDAGLKVKATKIPIEGAAIKLQWEDDE